VSAAKKTDQVLAAADQRLVLAELEPSQLAAVKKQHFPRRHLRGIETFFLWGLRIYVLFMVAVVIYQIWSGAR
jgi:hypothetical protein